MSKKHEGDLVAKRGVVYDFTAITGYVDCRGADTKTAFPKLTSIGGYVYCSGADTKFRADIKTNDINCDAVKRSTDSLLASFAMSGFLFCDGILSKVVSKKKVGAVVVYVVVLCGHTDTSYVVDKGGVYSHGKTLKEAKESLIFKITDRDTSKFKSWTGSTVISASDAIKSYRAITGACEFGVRDFCSDKDLKRKYTVSDVIKLTKGKYGSSEYAAFFGKVNV